MTHYDVHELRADEERRRNSPPIPSQPSRRITLDKTKDSNYLIVSKVGGVIFDKNNKTEEFIFSKEDMIKFVDSHDIKNYDIYELTPRTVEKNITIK